MMRKILRDNGLTLGLSLLFAASVCGMILTGHAAMNCKQLKHGASP
jgi:hypothetical protein